MVYKDIYSYSYYQQTKKQKINYKQKSNKKIINIHENKKVVIINFIGGCSDRKCFFSDRDFTIFQSLFNFSDNSDFSSILKFYMILLVSKVESIGVYLERISVSIDPFEI